MKNAIPVNKAENRKRNTAQVYPLLPESKLADDQIAEITTQLAGQPSTALCENWWLPGEQEPETVEELENKVIILRLLTAIDKKLALTHPELSVSKFFNDIERAIGLSSIESMFSLCLLDAYLERNQDKGAQLTAANVHSLVLISIGSTHKFMDDIPYDNASFAFLGQLTKHAYNKLERNFLDAIDYDLYSILTKEGYQTLRSQLKGIYLSPEDGNLVEVVQRVGQMQIAATSSPVMEEKTLPMPNPYPAPLMPYFPVTQTYPLQPIFPNLPLFFPANPNPPVFWNAFLPNPFLLHYQIQRLQQLQQLQLQLQLKQMALSSAAQLLYRTGNTNGFWNAGVVNPGLPQNLPAQPMQIPLLPQNNNLAYQGNPPGFWNRNVPNPQMIQQMIQPRQGLHNQPEAQSRMPERKY